jgi:hypothetical protein
MSRVCSLTASLAESWQHAVGEGDIGPFDGKMLFDRLDQDSSDIDTVDI